MNKPRYKNKATTSIRGRTVEGASGNVGRGLIASAIKSARGGLGVILLAAVLLIAFIGPLVAPHDPDEFVGSPYDGSGLDHLLGTDALGRDVLSRVLHGGIWLIAVAALATIIGVGIGTIVGLAAAYFRGAIEDVIMRAVDVLLAFPPILLVLVAVSVVGPEPWLIIAAVALTHCARTSRVVRGTAATEMTSDYISSVEVIGLPRWRIMLFELLPNVLTQVMVELGVRMTFSVGEIAVLGFLGFGRQPPAAGWGLMLQENWGGLSLQPLAVVTPVLAISMLTIGTYLLTDAVSHAGVKAK